MARFPLLFVLTALALYPPCAVGQPSATSQVVTLGDAQRTGRGGTTAEILKELAAKYPLDPGHPFSSTAHVKMLAEKLKKEPFLETYLTMYFAMVNAGMNQEVIDGVPKILDTARLDPDANMRFLRLLGLAYLRMGEQENCVTNHTAQSCLFPIQEGGVHKIQRGSRGALKVYETMLQKSPDDIRARWLLNLAYMTLGEYPDKVPAQWLYPESMFRSDYPLPRFDDIAPALGLDVEAHAGGCCVEDFDGDGDLDIMKSSWGVTDQIRYFRNNGDGTFTDRTTAAGLEGVLGGLNINHADYDNDGDADVFVMRGAWLGAYGEQPKSLLRNNGDGTFTDVTMQAGVASFHPGLTSAWADLDNDGDLDIFIGHETSSTRINPCELYRNNGDGTFTDVGPQVGMNLQGMVKGIAMGDYDNDGWMDVYVSCLGNVNFLMRNNGLRNGKWSFTDVAAKAGVQQPVFSFPAFFFDYDNDGWLDLFVSDYGGSFTGTITMSGRSFGVIDPVVNDYLNKPSGITTARLYRNKHDGTFEDVTVKMGMNKTLFGMGLNCGDLDNDGWLDIYVGTGTADLEALIPNRMFRNAEARRFQDVTTAGGFGHLQKGHGVAFADIDNDGDQDIFNVMGGAVEADVARSTLYRNPGNSNHWLTLMLEGVKANRFGVGARIKVTVERANGRLRDIHVMAGPGGSFGSASLQQEIGLGDARRIRSITILWPGSGTRQTVTKVEMDRVIQIREGSADIAVLERPAITMPAAGASPQHQHDHHGHDHQSHGE